MLIFLADSNLVHAYKRYAYKKNINFQKKSLASVRQQTESKKQPASNWEQQKNSPAQIAGLMPDCFGIILPSESAHMCRTCFFCSDSSMPAYTWSVNPSTYYTPTSVWHQGQYKPIATHYCVPAMFHLIWEAARNLFIKAHKNLKYLCSKIMSSCQKMNAFLTGDQIPVILIWTLEFWGNCLII